MTRWSVACACLRDRGHPPCRLGLDRFARDAKTRGAVRDGVTGHTCARGAEGCSGVGWTVVQGVLRVQVTVAGERLLLRRVRWVERLRRPSLVGRDGVIGTATATGGPTELRPLPMAASAVTLKKNERETT